MMQTDLKEFIEQAVEKAEKLAIYDSIFIHEYNVADFYRLDTTDRLLRDVMLDLKTTKPEWVINLVDKFKPDDYKAFQYSGCLFFFYTKFKYMDINDLFLLG
jgi:hypothetical protein